MTRIVRRYTEKQYACLPDLLLKTIGCLLIVIVLSACSHSDNDSDIAADMEFDACALLSEAGPAVILGGPVGDADHTQNDRLQKMKPAGVKMSHCGFSLAKSGSYKSVTLLIKYVDNYKNPQTAKAFIDTKQLDFGDFKFEPHEVPDLGDVAVWINSPGSAQLWVFWKKHYRMSISITDIEDDAAALQWARAAALIVLHKL